MAPKQPKNGSSPSISGIGAARPKEVISPCSIGKPTYSQTDVSLSQSYVTNGSSLFERGAPQAIGNWAVSCPPAAWIGVGQVGLLWSQS